MELDPTPSREMALTVEALDTTEITETEPELSVTSPAMSEAPSPVVAGSPFGADGTQWKRLLRLSHCAVEQAREELRAVMVSVGDSPTAAGRLLGADKTCVRRLLLRVGLSEESAQLRSQHKEERIAERRKAAAAQRADRTWQRVRSLAVSDAGKARVKVVELVAAHQGSMSRMAATLGVRKHQIQRLIGRLALSEQVARIRKHMNPGLPPELRDPRQRCAAARHALCDAAGDVARAARQLGVSEANVINWARQGCDGGDVIAQARRDRKNKKMLLAALDHCDWSVEQTGAMLNMTEPRLRRWLRSLGIPCPNANPKKSLPHILAPETARALRNRLFATLRANEGDFVRGAAAFGDTPEHYMALCGLYSVGLFHKRPYWSTARV